MKIHSKDSVCVAAILKDEDAFVEEWVAYHRLLGVDHFYLYDNDPSLPLSNVLALHRPYVTVRPWLVEHDDRHHAGRTKQLKAYTHCLKHDAPHYEWVTFLDGDEFIVLEEHPDLKAFLAEFERYDSIALNWHVFGHNGYYEDPPGLIIESLTRRMAHPRPMVKSLSRTEAIASIDSAHLCGLKRGRKRVDANKRPYREELYPGKTRVAHINHYQCRSFNNWMRKPERGKSGASAKDKANAWRFSQEGCLRQFVRQIALDKNELIDNSMLRHVEPLKRYLSLLRSMSKSEGSVNDTTLALPANLSETRATTGSRLFRPQRLVYQTVRLLMRNMWRVPRLFWSWLTLARATAAYEARDWPQAIRRWQHIVDNFGDKTPPEAFVALYKAHRGEGNFEAAEVALRQGQIKYPTNMALAAIWDKISRPRTHGAVVGQLSEFVFNTRRAIDDPADHGRQDFDPDQRHTAATCMVLLGSGDYNRVIEIVKKLKRCMVAESRLLNAIEGLAYLRSSQTEAARLHWSHYWQRAKRDEHFANEKVPKLNNSRYPINGQLFSAITSGKELINTSINTRVCVYTALFGEYDVLRPPVHVPVGVDFICFTDTERSVHGWETRIIDLDIDDPFIKNRKIKILPYDYLMEYDYSLYIDSNIIVVGDLLVAYNNWLKNKPFVAWPHPNRAGVYDELEAILVQFRHEPSAIIDQYEFFKSQSMPQPTGLIEACFLWRDHHDSSVRGLMEQWWNQIRLFGSRRDQPLLGYLMWKTGIKPAVLPEHLGTSRDNEFVCKFPHKQSVLDFERAIGRSIPGGERSVKL